MFVAGSEMMRTSTTTTLDIFVATGASGVIGAVTFTGSLIAFGKLQELKTFQKPLALPNGQIINGAIAVLTLVMAVWMCASGSVPAYWFVVIVASALGILPSCSLSGSSRWPAREPRFGVT